MMGGAQSKHVQRHTSSVFHTRQKYIHILQYVDMYGCSVCYVFGMVVWVPVSLEEVHNSQNFYPNN